MRCDLSDKVSLVTGAARGIGQAIADRLAANGSRVVYTDLDLEATRAAAEKSPGSLALALDVSKPDQIAATMERMLAEFGRLDILVNNAGINTPGHNRVTVEDYSRAEWDRILSVDLTAVFEMSKACLLYTSPSPRD